MNWGAKLKSVSFWTGIGGAVVMLLRAFGVEMGGETAENIINLVCGALVAVGIFKNSDKAKDSIKKITNLNDEIVDLSRENENETSKEDDIKKNNSK